MGIKTAKSKYANVLVVLRVSMIILRHTIIKMAR